MILAFAPVLLEHRCAALAMSGSCVMCWWPPATAVTSTLVGLVTAHLKSDSPLVRGMAVWAARQLVDEQSYQDLKLTHMADECDPMVRAEWV